VLKFFYASDTCALASHIALEEAGAEYEAVRLDFRGPMAGGRRSRCPVGAENPGSPQPHGGAPGAFAHPIHRQIVARAALWASGTK
jgi:hypothetical protein